MKHRSCTGIAVVLALNLAAVCPSLASAATVKISLKAKPVQTPNSLLSATNLGAVGRLSGKVAGKPVRSSCKQSNCFDFQLFAGTNDAGSLYAGLNLYTQFGYMRLATTSPQLSTPVNATDGTISGKFSVRSGSNRFKSARGTVRIKGPIRGPYKLTGSIKNYCAGCKAR